MPRGFLSGTLDGLEKIEGLWTVYFFIDYRGEAGRRGKQVHYDLCEHGEYNDFTHLYSG